MYSIEEIKNIIQNANFNADFEEKKEIYDGIYPILNKQKINTSKTNSKLINNYARVIVQNFVAFFLGDKFNINITNTTKEEEEKILDVLHTSNLYNNIDVLATNTSIYGVSYLLIYVNSMAELKTMVLEPQNVYIQKNVWNQTEYAIVKLQETDVYNNIKEYTIFYTKDNIVKFLSNGDTYLQLLESVHNPFKKIPVVEFENDVNKKNDFDCVLTLINAYNLLESNKLDANIDTKKALMWVNNVDLNSDFLNNMKEYNIVATKDTNSLDNTKQASIKYVERNDNNEDVEFLKLLETNIFVNAGCPNFQALDLTGGDTILAIKSKLYPIIAKTKIKENLFRSSFKYLFKCIMPYFKDVININFFNPNNLNIEFIRPIFTNIGEELDNAKKGQEIGLCKETILKNISFIKDVQEELEKEKEEEQKTE